MEKNVIVIGGSNLDICAKSLMEMVPNDSNIGKVQFGVGGVGRNIAEFLALLGNNTSLLTAVSDNGFGRVITDNANQQGITLVCDPFPESLGFQTGVYVYLVDDKGRFVIGVNEMDITELITPELVKKNINSLYFAEDVIIEANLPVKTIEYICSLGFKVFADCVSSVKCNRLSGVIDKLYLLKSNSYEAQVLTGASVLEEQIKTFAEKGLKRGIITLDSNGAACFEVLENSKINIWKMASPKDGKLVDTSGCGDAFLAGFTTALMRDKDMKQALVFGQAAAAINARSISSVNRNEFSYYSIKDYGLELMESIEIEEKQI